MGCNESKQAVATSDTISRRPFRKKLPSLTFKNQGSSVSDTTVATLPTANNNNDPPAEDVKDISVNTDLKNEETENVVVVQPGKSISSPDHFFSSRKDEDVAESVDTEEGYFSPNHDSVKDVELKSDGELKEEEVGKVNDQEIVSLVDHEKKIKEDEKGKLENLEEPKSSKIDEQQNAEAFESPPVIVVEDEKNLVVPLEAPTDALTESSKSG